MESAYESPGFTRRAKGQAAPIMRDIGSPTKLTEPRLGCSPPRRRQERREASGGTLRARSRDRRPWIVLGLIAGFIGSRQETHKKARRGRYLRTALVARRDTK